MNWWQVLGSLVVTLPAVLLIWRFVPPRGRLLALVLAVLVGVPLHEPAGEVLEDLLSPGQTTVDHTARQVGRWLAKEPRMREAITGRSQLEADALVSGFTAAGLATMPAWALDRRAAVLKHLVDQGDDELAAGLFTGTVAPAKLKAALNRLPPAEINDWLRINAVAALGALHPVPALTSKQQVRAISALVTATELDGTRLTRIFQDPHPSTADAAWAARKVYDTLATMPTQPRVQAERALVAPSSAVLR
ncbi:MAG: hypothetical protein JWM80_1999 [Cyanobacteria bacterium RYN_339]|nr:hypothetical protein [Cyanobacteria bacterium RYN_339]